MSDQRRLLDEWDLVVSSLQRPADQTPGRAPARSVPVTVVGGFLGAGKTSLIRHLLTSDHGLRLAVVVNDVGAINIDAALIADTDSERIELTNGCSCCTLGPDLARSLDDLAHRPEPPDAVIIEASGVGDPTGIATVIGGSSDLSLDGIIAVVDATAYRRSRNEPRIARLLQRQLDAAHLVVLNRCDALTPDDVGRVVDLVGAAAPGRPVVPVEHGALDPVIALSAASRGARPHPSPSELGSETFVTTVIEVPTPITRAGLEDSVRALGGPLRAKGFVELLENPGRRQIVQVVGRAWSVEDAGPRRDDDAIGQLVVISLSRAAG